MRALGVPFKLTGRGTLIGSTIASGLTCLRYPDIVGNKMYEQYRDISYLLSNYTAPSTIKEVALNFVMCNGVHTVNMNDLTTSFK